MSPRVDPPEAATDGDNDEGHEGDDHRAEVDVGVRKVRLLRNVLRLCGIDVPGFEVLAESLGVICFYFPFGFLHYKISSYFKSIFVISFSFLFSKHLIKFLN